jgi:two-component system sensor histidine kinase DesK
VGVETELPWADRRVRLARLLTLVWLATSVWTSVVMPGIGVLRESRPGWIAAGAVGIGAFSVAQAGALYVAVTPWMSRPARRRWLTAFVSAAAASLVLVGPVAAGQWATWAWLGAGIVATAPLLVRPWVAGAVAVACTGAAVAVAAWTGGPLADAAIITAGIGASIAAVNWAPVWLWGLLVEAQLGRDAQGRLAATEERLRFARDVHDLLGHNLTVIALKAELAARLVPMDPGAAQSEAAQIQRLATSALSDVREAVHGYRTVDLASELAAVRQVLSSSGIRCTVQEPPGQLSGAVATQLAAVLREATTNILRHSRASWCTITIASCPDEVRLTVANDGATGQGSDARSYGLRGLADRLDEAGGGLRVERDGTVFTLEATVRTVA